MFRVCALTNPNKQDGVWPITSRVGRALRTPVTKQAISWSHLTFIGKFERQEWKKKVSPQLH